MYYLDLNDYGNWLIKNDFLNIKWNCSDIKKNEVIKIIEKLNEVEVEDE